MTDKLTDFEASPVIAAKIEIPDAAGGLREAMAVDPVELHHGDEGLVVLRYRVKKVRFDEASPKLAKDLGEEEGALVRVHVFETLEAMFMDDANLEKQVRENAVRVKLAVEEAAGKMALLNELDQPDDAELAAELVKAHKNGLHPHHAVVGCASCDEREADRASEAKSRKDLD